MEYDFAEYNKFLEKVKKLYENVEETNNDFDYPGHGVKQRFTKRNIAIKFDNEWGIDIFFGDGSYGSEEGLLEMAVLRVRGEDGLTYLHYNNPVAEGDVRGYLTADEALELTKEVASWKKDEIFPEWEDENGND